MQFLKLTIAIVATSFLTSMAADAAVLRDARGPAEVPPASFKSSQYVDSTGCVFVRAGVGNSVTWVPRVTRNRKLVCGYSPSLGRTTQTVQASQKPAASKPLATAVVTTAPTVQTVRTPSPAPTVAASAKVQPKTVYQQTAARPVPKLPKGYKPVWDDGRLNPRRGLKTANGDAAMRMVWTDTVPRRLVPEAGQDVKLVQAHLRFQAANGTTTGTKTAPKKRVSSTGNGRYVQVGTFSVSANVKTTARKFTKMGLPVASSATKNGARIVFLGPFTSNSDLTAGLNAARSAGFKDAFIK